MNARKPRQNFVWNLISLNDESKLCFGAAAGCLAVGALGWLAHFLLPGGASLRALTVVGCFYLVLGLISLFKRSGAHNTEQSAPQSDAALVSRAVSNRRSDDLESVRSVA